jgi:hypothetical protein
MVHSQRPSTRTGVISDFLSNTSPLFERAVSLDLVPLSLELVHREIMAVNCFWEAEFAHSKVPVKSFGALDKDRGSDH